MKIKRALALLLTLCMVLGVAGPGLRLEAKAASDAVKVEHNGETTYYADLQKAFDGFAPSNNSYGGTYVITLLGDIPGMTAVKNFQYPTEVMDITLDLNGYTITGNGTNIAVNINIGSNNSSAASGSVTIKDSSGDNSGKITGGKGGVYVYGKGATLYFQGGTITGNHGASKGGGILVGATTKLIMTGGVITGNSVTGSSSANTGLGGGVLANYADILGGEIYGNVAYKGSHLQTGRGGGICTEITRTSGYSTLNIANGVVYGNTAENAGDDVMAQGNGSAKFSLSIGTENWYIDGWNGTKATSGGGQTDRYSAETAVAYTDGGFTDVKNKTVGLKYVAPAAPSVPEYTVTYTDGVDGEEIFADQTYTVKEGEATPAFDGTPAREGYTFIGWNPAVAETVTADAVYTAQWEENAPVRPEQPALPQDNGSNVTDQLITIICDTDEGHTSKTYGWGDPAANIVFPTGSEPVWNEELNAWTIGVRIDSIGTYYVWERFEKTCNGINHEIVKGAPLTSDEYYRIDTTLVWNAASLKWQTLTGEPFVIHTTCQTVPNAPTFFDHLRKYQIKVIGTVDGEEVPFFVNLDEASVAFGQVTGNREDGFTCQVTITLKDGDTYVTTWIEKKAPGVPYIYDFEKTTNPIVLTLTYDGDLNGELNDDWTLGITGNTVATAYLTMDAPEAPDKLGKNVTTELVKIICDSDHNHTALCVKWQHQSTKVRDGVVWSDEYNTWIVPIRIDSVSIYYVWLNFEKVYNEITHNMVDENQKCIDTYLKWDAEKQLWVTLDEKPIDVHVVCQTAPEAPTGLPSSFQIQVKGDLDHDGIYGENKSDCALGISELFTTTIPAGGYTLGEIYGSREEGFFVDVTVTLEDGDIYLTNWIENRAGGKNFVYDWDMTQKTVTFTLKYNRSLTGTLYGSNKTDWAANFSGYQVGEAFVKENIPAPKQDNVTDKLVAIICDSDGERHQTVYGKWYPLGHCTTTSDIVWDDELNTYVVDIRIGSLYIMYVDQLEDANNDTRHELAEDITSINSRLKWDYEQNLWVTLDGQPIELHTTCRTAPLAPEHNQVKSYQIKVWGDVDGTETAYTISLPEGSYTLSEVRGSREEGFFVDVTITLADGDAFVTGWTEKKVDPGITYVYDTERTEMTITFTLRYNGDLNGTLYGDRHAANTNYDWIIGFNHNNYPLTYGVIAEAYVVHHHVPGEPATCTEPQLCMECEVELHPSLEDALAQAIAELEKAIADGDEANADALAEAVAKLEKAIADMEAAIAANGASIADLEAAVAQLQEAVDALEEAYKAADAALKDELEAAIAQAQEALQATIDALAERVAQNEGNIEQLQKQLAELEAQLKALEEDHGADVTALEAEIAALKDKIAALESADKEMAEGIEELNQLIEALTQRVAALEESYATKAALEAAINELKALIAASDEANAEALAQAVAALEAKLAEAVKALEGTDAENRAALEAMIAEAKASLRTAIDQVQKNLDNAEAALKQAIAAGDAALAQKIDDLNAALSAAIAASNAADEALKAELTAAIDAAKSALTAAIEQVAADLAATRLLLNTSMAAGDKALHNRINELTAALEAAIAAAEAADADLSAELEKAVETLNAAIAQVQKNLDNAEAALKEKDAQHDAELDRLNTFVTVVCVIASLALVGCATLLVITIIGKRKKV